MFGTRPRTRRPLLLVLVFGAFLAIIGITATAQAVMVSLHSSTGTLNTIVAGDTATVRAVLNGNLTLADLDPATGPTLADRAVLEADLARLLGPGEILRVELRRLDGSIVAASLAGLAGVQAGPGAADVIATGTPSVALVPVAESEAGPGDLGSPTVLREFLPITTGGEVRAVVGIWRDAVPILVRLDDLRRDVVLVTLTAALLTSGLLFLIFRAAQLRLTRQTAALVEATQLDPLTESLNHGALVAHLATAIEAARGAGTPLGVALVDLDNFRLLNDTHGHRAGDEALLRVGDALRRELPASAVMGRYGPDEFLVVAPAESVVDLEPAIGRLRVALADLSLQFESTERLPITVSAGLCTYPDDGASVTVLLAAAARTLQEAKASGGDSIRVAGSADPPAETGASGFDILHGLVLAVDTKDRYTKRHSEDVARYGVFLARRLGLEADLVRSIHVAGLLHDVGKIGIPDAILRKPGKLTAAEYEIVMQHVALGDMIVRDVPNTDLVRAGIRHHHERWDGDGYLDRLAGEEIPLIARVLAVGDAFSAMTTTRPYRKALDLREALTRLEDAAGTQLDEIMVRTFVEGIETDADAPLPGRDAPGPALWTPSQVA
jgi:diguanylate cyclase (GGDEF)-like protein